MRIHKAIAVAIVGMMLLSGLFSIAGSGQASMMKDTRNIRAPSSLIRIESNSDFALQATSNAWPGDGSAVNPYVIKDLDMTYSLSDTGVYIANTTVFFIIEDGKFTPIGTTLDDNQYWYLSTGITLKNVTNCRVSNITTTGFYFGVRVSSSHGVIVDNCTLSDARTANARVEYCHDVLVENNTLSHSDGMGVSFSNTVDSIIQLNNASFNGNSGINIDFFVSGNVIRWNLASRNGNYADGEAVYVGGSNNVIYGNILVACGGTGSMPARSGNYCVNDWNSSEGIGNYYGCNYDRWTGKYGPFLGTSLCSSMDNNSDLIADDAYVIRSLEGKEKDYHPLMKAMPSPINLTVTYNNKIGVRWEAPSYFTEPIGRYCIICDNGTGLERFYTQQTSIELTITDTNWVGLNFTVRWEGKYLSSAESDKATLRHPDKPWVEITSELGVHPFVIGNTVVYSNSTVDPRSVKVEWMGMDSNSNSMSYWVMLDDGEWVSKGQSTNCTFRGLAEGIHTVRVKAVDSDLNEVIGVRSFYAFQYANISVSCTPEKHGDGLVLQIKGKIMDYATNGPISGASIALAYSVSDGSWNSVDVVSDANGRFNTTVTLTLKSILGITLITSLLDHYQMPHFYFQNITYAAVEVQGRNGIFLSHSSSVISDYSWSKEFIKFNVSDESDGIGNVTISVPKSSVQNIGDITIYLDGVKVKHAVQDSGDYYVFTVNYTNGDHEVTVDMAVQKLLGGDSSLIILAGVALIGAVGAIIYLKFRRKP